jgi:hypothetical protein
MKKILERKIKKIKKESIKQPKLKFHHQFKNPILERKKKKNQK